MPYGDEENITARRAAQVRSKLDIAKEVELGQYLYSFKTRPFPALHFSMVVPEQMDEFSAEALVVKYPSQFRPQIILTVPDGSFDLSLQRMEKEPVQPEGIMEMVQTLRMAAKRMNPSAVYAPVDWIDADIPAACFESWVDLFDGEIWQMTFGASIKGVLLMGGFCAPKEQSQSWSVLARQMIETLHILPD